MAKRVQLRRGATPQTSIFIGAVGEVTVDTDKDVLVVHDGATAGGFPVAARANADGTISLIKKDGASAGVINATGLFNNTLTSTNTNQALTASQGKVLQDNKLDTTSAFGVGQTWQNLTASRSLGVTYTNSTGKTIMVKVTGYTSAGSYQTGIVGGSTVDSFQGYSSGLQSTVTLIVPNDSTYSVTGNKISWWELR